MGGSFSQFGCGPSAAELYNQIWRKVQAGDLGAALHDADSGLSRFPKPDNALHWKFLTLKAEILMRQGSYENSLALLKDDLPQEFAHSESAVWRKLTQSSSLTYLSRLSDAERALSEAQSLASSAQSQLLGEVFLRQGTLASVQADMPAAQSHFRASLQFASSHHDAFLEASALGSLGVAAERMEHHDESMEWSKQALALIQANSWQGLAAKVEGNLAWSYFQLGDYEQALAQYQIAENDSVRAGLEHEQVLWLTSLADTNYALGQYQTARDQAQKALQLAIKLGDPADIINCRQDSALIAIQNGQYAEAQTHLQEAAKLDAAAPDVVNGLYTRLLGAHLLARTRDFVRAASSYSAIVANPNTPTYLRWEAQANLAQAHAALGNSALAEREFLNALATFSTARKAINEDYRLSFVSAAIRFYDAYVNFLIDQRRPGDALRAAELSRAQTLEEGLATTAKHGGKDRAVNPQALATRLHATLLFYWLGQEKSWLWAITPARTTLVPLPASAELRDWVDGYRKSFVDDPSDPLESKSSNGRKLYDILIQPVRKLIPSDGRVYVFPDGRLSLLNFETLIVPACVEHCAPSRNDQAHYWIEDVTVTTATSLSLLARSSYASPPRVANILLVGKADFASPDFPPLAQAGKEIGLLEKRFSEDHRFTLTENKATASGYLNSHPESFSYIHFTAHGTASRLQPLDSAIILSREGDSFKLYARDILKHPLSAYLVTISACNGAGTKTYAGEGLVGLSWAFLRAGAHNVIGGLWEVSNASTPQLMDELYKNLSDDQNAATALRNAKLTLVHSSGNYRRPFYWAPFLLYAGS